MTVHIEGMIVYPENWIIIDFPILWVKYLYNLPHLTDIVTYNHGPETAVNTIPRKKKKRPWLCSYRAFKTNFKNVLIIMNPAILFDVFWWKSQIRSLTYIDRIFTDGCSLPQPVLLIWGLWGKVAHRVHLAVSGNIFPCSSWEDSTDI